METVRGDKVKAYTRSKAPLALMEQLIMILVFAAAAAVCVRAFVYASQLSKEGSDRQLAQKRLSDPNGVPEGGKRKLAGFVRGSFHERNQRRPV